MSRPRVLIIGGGFGGIETFRRLHRCAHRKRGLDLTLIDQNNYFLFTPMLHEAATGSVSRTHLTVPLREMVHCCRGRFLRARALKVDRSHRKIKTDDRVLHYDYCVVAVGSRSADFGVPGIVQYAYPLKTLGDCTRLRNRIVHCFEEASRMENKRDRCALLHFVVVGGGPTGVEMAGQLGQLLAREMRALYPGVECREAVITLIESNEKIMMKNSDYFSVQAAKKLHTLGVRVVTNTRVLRVESSRVRLSDGNHLDACTVVWTSGVQSNADRLFDAHDLNSRGMLAVTESLHMEHDARVYALGDCAAIADTVAGFVPQSAQAAVQQARVVACNIERAVRGRELRVYRYRIRGDLVPVGDWFAVAQVGPVRFKGRFAWWLRRTVFLITMYNWGDRLRIALDWSLNIFTYRDTSEL